MPFPPPPARPLTGPQAPSARTATPRPGSRAGTSAPFLAPRTGQAAPFGAARAVMPPPGARQTLDSLPTTGLALARASQAATTCPRGVSPHTRSPICHHRDSGPKSVRRNISP